MYKHILIPTDGSELSLKAVPHGLALAKAVGAETSILMATKMWSAMEMTEHAGYGERSLMAGGRVKGTGHAL